MRLRKTSFRQAERRAARKPAPASRGTRLALRPSLLAQTSSEPRRSFPTGDRCTYSFGEGQS